MRKKEIIIMVAATILVAILTFLIPGNNSDYIKNSKLYISEVVASNKSIIKDNYGEYSDYIELYNDTNHDINLKGYHLSDSEFETDKWIFPNITIKSHTYLLVYTSQKDECNFETNTCHTNFKLSSTGEVVTLSDNSGNIISKITYPALDQDTSYSYTGNKYIVTLPSPGKKNNKIEQKNSSKNYNLEITEYMTHNKRFNYDSYGNYYDWIEIHNKDKKDLLIEEIYVTDDEANLKKAKITNQSITKDGYLLIYFTNDNISYTDGNYATFGLSDNDKYIMLTDGVKIIDKVSIVTLLDNISYGKVKDKWLYFTTPTPGKINNTASFEKIGGSDGNS